MNAELSFFFSFLNLAQYIVFKMLKSTFGEHLK